MQIPVLGSTPAPVKQRSLDMLATDTSAVHAIAQAAVSVELFTIPLYMNSMYSIYGTHQINSKGINYYNGRQWPGMSTTAKPVNANERAFNIIFSVFIQEMLHLQMAANLATALDIDGSKKGCKTSGACSNGASCKDAKPSFTGPELQTETHGWKCYGPTLTTIPHIVDLKDTKSYKHVRVNLEALNENQIDLFLAIEQPEEQGRKELEACDRCTDKYFPAVPFANWTPEKTSADLPMFGTIGYMYECYAQYISIEYTDGETLWKKLFHGKSVQQDLFNVKSGGHMPEFPGFSTLFGPEEDDGGEIDSFNKAIDMMCAITDQGEGSEGNIKRYRRARKHVLTAVLPVYREDHEALIADYPSYTNEGNLTCSRDAAARFDSTALDHYERFTEVKTILHQVSTWEQWHQDANNRWTAEMLTNSAWDAASAPQNIPAPQEVAEALNRLKQGGKQEHDTMSTVSTGAIYGITSVLDCFWQDQKTAFPYPSMGGSGDRMSICWAVFGKAPNLLSGVPAVEAGRLYHACQGMNLDDGHPDSDPNSCAALAIYHTCKGSNGCKAQGGCGFVQSDSGGSNCGSASCGGPTPPSATVFSSPADNKCGTFGGCAVPISASQLFPTSPAAKMALYNFGPGPDFELIPLPETMNFVLGDGVYEKAWEAYTAVMKARDKDAGAPPKPTDLRVALPPST